MTIPVAIWKFDPLRADPQLERLSLADHLQRLEQTARLAGSPLSVGEPGVQLALRQMAIATCRFERLLPEAKLTRFLDRARQLRQSPPAGVSEAVMVNSDGGFRDRPGRTDGTRLTPGSRTERADMRVCS